jgi:hypothetical protein
MLLNLTSFSNGIRINFNSCFRHDACFKSNLNGAMARWLTWRNFDGLLEVEMALLEVRE